MKDARIAPSMPADMHGALATVHALKTARNAQEIRAVRKDLVDVMRGNLVLDQPIPVEFSNYLIKLNGPCTFLTEGCKVYFEKNGGAVIKEVIDETNFTIETTENLTDGADTMTVVEVKNVHTVNDDTLLLLSLSAIREVSDNILDETVLKKIDARMATIEKFFMSALTRLRRLENL